MSFAFKKAGLKDDSPRDVISKFVSLDCSKDKSLTVQADANEVDINRIVGRVLKGHPVLTSSGEPFYGDVSDLGGLQEALMKVQEADDLFMQYPASLREKFENDPVKFVDYLSDPKNLDEAISLGLAKAKPVPAVPEPPVVTPPATELPKK